MSLSHAVLGVLSGEPLHGYAVRVALGELIGSFWPVNQGQVYATLKRLRRDGLVDEIPRRPGKADGERRCYAISTRGRQALDAWLSEPGEPGPHDGLGFDDWVAHLAVCERIGDAALLRATIDVQRRRCETLRHALTPRVGARQDAPATRAARALLAAELDWLDLVQRELLKSACAARIDSPSGLA